MALLSRLTGIGSSLAWARRDAGRRAKCARELDRSQWWQPGAVEELALQRLRRLLAHAVTSCPYYQRISRRLGVGPEDIRKAEDLVHWPILQKSDILAHGPDLCAQGWPESDRIWSASSGTTGPPVKFIFDHAALASRMAAMWRHDGWAGWRPGVRRALLWGATQDFWPVRSLRSRARAALVTRRLLELDATQLSASNVEGYVARLRDFRPQTMLAYAQYLTRFARYIQNAGLEPPRMDAIIVTAEALQPQDRRLVESVFGCPVFDRYGSRETGVIASQCSKESPMHINAESVLVEFLRDDRHVRSGQYGEVIVTDLGNYAMPFIRYRIGDVASPQEGRCECGRGLPLMAPMAGRTADYVICPDGRAVNGIWLASQIQDSVPGVLKVQIGQSGLGELTVRLVPNRGFSVSCTNRLREKLAECVQQNVTCRFEVVNDIPPELPSGKYRFVISEIPPERVFGNTMTSAAPA